MATITIRTIVHATSKEPGNDVSYKHTHENTVEFIPDLYWTINFPL